MTLLEIIVISADPVKKKMRRSGKYLQQADLLSDFGRRLKDEIRRNDYTEKDLAKRIGISQSQMTRYVKGKIPPPLDKLARLASILGVSIDYLWTGDPSPYKEHIPACPDEARKLHEPHSIDKEVIEAALMDLEKEGGEKIWVIVHLMRDFMAKEERLNWETADLRREVQELIKRIGELELKLERANLREIVREELDQK